MRQQFISIPPLSLLHTTLQQAALKPARLLLLALTGFWSVQSIAAPAVGDIAPAFSLQGSDGKSHQLADLKGRPVVIAFFPKAFTGG